MIPGWSSRTIRSSGVMISVRAIVSSRWSRKASWRTSLSPRVTAARCMWPFCPTPPGPYRCDSPSQAITAVTSSPARACSAAVPPQPSSSSSGCAAITRTRLLIGPPLPGPRLLGERAPLEHRAVLGLELEQRDGSLAARHQLAARLRDPARHHPEDLPEPRVRRRRGGHERRLPDPPAAGVEAAESG